jgi:hypothetical protein
MMARVFMAVCGLEDGCMVPFGDFWERASPEVEYGAVDGPVAFGFCAFANMAEDGEDEFPFAIGGVSFSNDEEGYGRVPAIVPFVIVVTETGRRDSTKLLVVDFDGGLAPDRPSILVVLGEGVEKLSVQERGLSAGHGYVWHGRSWLNV